jgi:hypothetical protein
MQNPTSKRISCLSLTRAQEAQTPMKSCRCRSTPRRRPLRLPPKLVCREVFAEWPTQKRKEYLDLLRMVAGFVAGARGPL